MLKRRVQDTSTTHNSSGDPRAINASSEEEEDAGIFPKQRTTDKHRVLVFSSRGLTARARHLLEDVRRLLPHHKKETKFDAKGDIRAVNEIAEVKSCNSVLFFDVRKRSDLYMWASKTPDGPSAKFLVTNLHTMDELRLTGNGMLGSRPLLSFDRSFDVQPHLQLLRVIFTDIFGTPKGHPKAKPFTDRVLSFHFLDNRIWIRNYQILDTHNRKCNDSLNLSQLVEIGPRLVLTTIRIFAGSFSGATLYTNPMYVSPNDMRSKRARTHASASAATNFAKNGSKLRSEGPSDLQDTFV